AVGVIVVPAVHPQQHVLHRGEKHKYPKQRTVIAHSSWRECDEFAERPKADEAEEGDCQPGTPKRHRQETADDPPGLQPIAEGLDRRGVETQLWLAAQHLPNRGGYN